MAILNQADDIVEIVSSRVLRLLSGLKAALTLDGAQNATFAGDVAVTGDVDAAGDIAVAGDVIAGDRSAFYFGDGATVGDWRIVRADDDLVIQRLEVVWEDLDPVDTWVTKSTIAAAEE
jgi:hypothetical protein